MSFDKLPLYDELSLTEEMYDGEDPEPEETSEEPPKWTWFRLFTMVAAVLFWPVSDLVCSYVIPLTDEFFLARPWQIVFDSGPYGRILRDRFGGPYDTVVTNNAGKPLRLDGLNYSSLVLGIGRIRIVDDDSGVGTTLVHWGRPGQPEDVCNEIIWALNAKNVKK